MHLELKITLLLRHKIHVLAAAFTTNRFRTKPFVCRFNCTLNSIGSQLLNIADNTPTMQLNVDLKPLKRDLAVI